MLGFYTSEFRDLFFDEKPPERMFRSLVTIFAGYWRPSLVSRIWIALFFWLVRLQRWIGFAPRGSYKISMGAVHDHEQSQSPVAVDLAIRRPD